MPSETREAISRFYDGIFHCYEPANRFLTLGLDRRWRRKAAVAALEGSPSSCLDVCTGTGELALLLRELSPGAKITAADFNDRMLEAARGKCGDMNFIRADAARMPFPDDSFGAVTIAFATRNLNAEGDLAGFFREFRRVLKPGGAFVNLETSRPRSALVLSLFRLYVRLMTALVGAFCPENRAAYSFLSSSIRTFHAADELSNILLSAGFAKVEVTPLVFGALAIHRAVK